MDEEQRRETDQHAIDLVKAVVDVTADWMEERSMPTVHWDDMDEGTQAAVLSGLVVPTMTIANMLVGIGQVRRVLFDG